MAVSMVNSSAALRPVILEAIYYHCFRELWFHAHQKSMTKMSKFSQVKGEAVKMSIPESDQHVYEAIDQYKMDTNPFRGEQLLTLLDEAGITEIDHNLRPVRSGDGDKTWRLSALLTKQFVILLEDQGNGWYLIEAMISRSLEDTKWPIEEDKE